MHPLLDGDCHSVTGKHYVAVMLACMTATHNPYKLAMFDHKLPSAVLPSGQMVGDVVWSRDNTIFGGFEHLQTNAIQHH